jgi:hypothetical protein
MILLPTMNPERGMLRAVQCQATDPVSWAMSDGQTVADFPEQPGWSALDSARRAVAEHRQWLFSDGWVYPPHGWVGTQSEPSDPTVRTLGLLFTAARAGLFFQSITEGEAELSVTAAGVADSLAERDPGCCGTVEGALECLETAGGAQTRISHSVAPLLDVVRNLPAYTASPRLAMATG